MATKKVMLVCTQCLSRNYTVPKSVQAGHQRLKLMKFCKKCKKHTEHTESR